jgi:hypothetical protein
MMFAKPDFSMSSEHQQLDNNEHDSAPHLQQPLLLSAQNPVNGYNITPLGSEVFGPSWMQQVSSVFWHVGWTMMSIVGIVNCQ